MILGRNVTLTLPAIAVLRDQSLLAVDDPQAGRLQAGDRLILMDSGGGPPGRPEPQR